MGVKRELFLNNGAGVFSASSNSITLSDARTYATCLVLADADGDGDLDLFAGSGKETSPSSMFIRSEFSCYMLTNNGAGVFNDMGAVIDFPSGLAGWRGSGFFAVGDLDGDGNLEVFQGWSSWSFATPGALPSRVVHWTAPSALSAPTVHAFVLADIDGDGDLDAFIARSTTDIIAINGGAGNFTRQRSSAATSGVAVSTDAAFGDFDGDGDLDLFVVRGSPNHVGPKNEFYANDGLGNFAIASSSDIFSAVGLSSSVVLADLTGDGILDIAVANTDSTLTADHLYFGQRLFSIERKPTHEAVINNALTARVDSLKPSYTAPLADSHTRCNAPTLPIGAPDPFSQTGALLTEPASLCAACCAFQYCGTVSASDYPDCAGKPAHCSETRCTSVLACVCQSPKVCGLDLSAMSNPSRHRYQTGLKLKQYDGSIAKFTADPELALNNAMPGARLADVDGDGDLEYAHRISNPRLALRHSAAHISCFRTPVWTASSPPSSPLLK